VVDELVTDGAIPADTAMGLASFSSVRSSSCLNGTVSASIVGGDRLGPDTERVLIRPRNEGLVDAEADVAEWLSVILWTPKLFSSVKKKVSPVGPPDVPTP
jgi:hypothetical protein